MLVDLWARSNAPLTLGFLMEDYVEHLVHHLAQIGVACGAGNLQPAFQRAWRPTRPPQATSLPHSVNSP